MMPKTNCRSCGTAILVTTAARNDGRCVSCARGTRAQIDAARQRAVEPQPPRPEPLRVEPTAAAIIRVLDQIADLESETELLALEGALNALDNAPAGETCIRSLLAVFERCPWSDGYGVCWSIVHAIEDLPAYEPLLVASVRRAPGRFNLMMVNARLNGGGFVC